MSWYMDCLKSVGVLRPRCWIGGGAALMDIYHACVCATQGKRAESECAAGGCPEWMHDDAVAARRKCGWSSAPPKLEQPFLAPLFFV